MEGERGRWWPFNHSCPAVGWRVSSVAAQNFLAQGVGPAVGRFVQAYTLEAKPIVVSVAIMRIENAKSDERKILYGRYKIKHDRFVVGQGCEKVDDCGIVAPSEKGMVPRVHNVTLGNGLDVGKIHHHAVGRLAVGLNDFSGEGDFQYVAMTVQVTALTGVIWNPVPGIEFQFAGNTHEGGRIKRGFRV